MQGLRLGRHEVTLVVASRRGGCGDSCPQGGCLITFTSARVGMSIWARARTYMHGRMRTWGSLIRPLSVWVVGELVASIYLLFVVVCFFGVDCLEAVMFSLWFPALRSNIYL